jgi:uncharacterized C2H2 Zn-finger protein
MKLLREDDRNLVHVRLTRRNVDWSSLKTGSSASLSADSIPHTTAFLGEDQLYAVCFSTLITRDLDAVRTVCLSPSILPVGSPWLRTALICVGRTLQGFHLPTSIQANLESIHNLLNFLNCLEVGYSGDLFTRVAKMIDSVLEAHEDSWICHQPPVSSVTKSMNFETPLLSKKEGIWLFLESPCPVCSRVFHNNEQLVAHLKLNHQYAETEAENLLASAPAHWHCAQCSNKFQDSWAYTGHLKAKHKAKSALSLCLNYYHGWKSRCDARGEKQSSDQQKSLVLAHESKCPICLKSLTKTADVVSHLKRIHELSSAEVSQALANLPCNWNCVHCPGVSFPFLSMYEDHLVNCHKKPQALALLHCKYYSKGWRLLDCDLSDSCVATASSRPPVR